MSVAKTLGIAICEICGAPTAEARRVTPTATLRCPRCTSSERKSTNGRNRPRTDLTGAIFSGFSVLGIMAKRTTGGLAYACRCHRCDRVFVRQTGNMKAAIAAGAGCGCHVKFQRGQRSTLSVGKDKEGTRR